MLIDAMTYYFFLGGQLLKTLSGLESGGNITYPKLSIYQRFLEQLLPQCKVGHSGDSSKTPLRLPPKGM